MNVLVMAGFGAVVLALVVGWRRASREIRSVPEGAFAALGTTRSNWENLLLHSPPFAVPLYFLRFRRHLLSAAEHATDLMPGWYPDQNDSTLERWFDGRAWTDLVRQRT
jgi:hypothetical protein